MHTALVIPYCDAILDQLPRQTVKFLTPCGDFRGNNRAKFR